jgi:outer membrane protein OmpA-like peptidoglycan-associated protein
MKLGKQRVDFVIDQLVQRGVPRALLEGRSAGERLKPTKRPNESQDLWRKRSRRVELVKVTGASK